MYYQYIFYLITMLMKSNSTQIISNLPGGTGKKFQCHAGVHSLIRVSLTIFSKSFIFAFIFALVYLLIPQHIFAQGSQTFTSDGTFTVPAGVTHITVECWGAGGGGASISTTNGSGGGGGGGAYASRIIIVTPGNMYDILVGIGGSAGIDGGNSNFNNGDVVAAGGSGASDNSSIGGAGGSILNSFGTAVFAGGTGGDGNGTTYSGGGGGGAGSSGDGGNATGQIAGTGTPLNGGTGGEGITIENDGNPGLVYGGGGSGALRTASDKIGGSGANGLVIVSWTCSSASIAYGGSPFCNAISTPQSVTISGSTGGTFSALPVGLTVDANSGAITPSTSTVNIYTVTYAIDAVGGCPAVNTTATVSIKPVSTLSGQSTNGQTQCFNGTFSPITVTATGTGLSYQWFSNTTPSTSGGNSLGSSNGAITASYTPQATTAGTLYYYCKVHSDCGPDLTSDISGPFIVNPPTAINSQSTNTQSQCINGVFAPLTVTATGTGTLTYQWYSNTSASTSGGSSLGSAHGANTSSYTPQANDPGILYYYCIVHSDCGDDVTSNISGAITVNPVTAITSQVTGGQTQCFNGPFDPIAVTAVGAGLTYQWYSNTTSSNSGGSSLGSANGAQTNTYTPQSTAAGTLYYYCVAHSNCGANVTSSVSGAFKVNPATEITDQSTESQTQCINGAFNPISVTVAGTEPITYQWYSNTTPVISGGSSLGSAHGAQTNIYIPQATTAGTLYYYCIVSGICGASVSSTISGAFIVNPVTIITSQSTNAQTQCINGTFTPITVTLVGTGLNYQWYSNTTASTTGGISLGSSNGAQTSSYSPQAASAGTLYYYCKINSSCGSVTSLVSGAFTVNPVSVGGTISGGSSPITYGSSTGTMSITGQTGLVVKWQKMFGAGAWTDINVTTTTYSEIPGSAGTWQYRAQVKSGECTEAYSSPLTIIVSPKTITITPTTGQNKIFGDADPPFTYTNSEFGDNSNFSGVLGRSGGENVGNYAYTLSSLSAGPNYTLVLASGPEFSITAKPVVITPDAGQTKIFGAADPTFTYTFAPALLGSDVFTGQLTRESGENVGVYDYLLGTLSAGINYSLSIVGTNKFTILVSTGVEDLQGDDGLKFKNYPNPFRSYTTLSYTLPTDGRVTVTISDIHGKLVKTVISDEMQTQGEYILTINDWSDSGMYIATLKLKINNKELQRTIKLIKGN